MTRTKKKAMLLSVLFAAMTSATALHAGSVTLAPAVAVLRGDAGQSTTQKLTFTNGTSVALSFEMIAMDVVVRDGKRTFVAAGATPGSIAATAVYTQQRVTVLPGKSVNVGVTVTIPPQPAVRAIVVMCKGTTKLARGPVGATASVGTLLTFALSGDVIAAEASPLIVEPPTASSNLVASQQVSSSGTEPMVATGMLAVLDAGGAMVGKQAIPPWRLLPGERTDMRVEYAGELPPGRYRAMVTFDLTDKTLTSSAEFSVK